MIHQQKAIMEKGNVMPHSTSVYTIHMSEQLPKFL